MQEESGDAEDVVSQRKTSTESRLVLTNVTRSENGSYMCEASNPHGQARKTTALVCRVFLAHRSPSKSLLCYAA